MGRHGGVQGLGPGMAGVQGLIRRQATAVALAVMARVHQVMPDKECTPPATAASTDNAIILQSGIRQFIQPALITRRSTV